MSLIMDALKRVQQVRLQELRKVPFFTEPTFKREKRLKVKKYFLIFAIAGSGILLLLFLWFRLVPLLTSDQRQTVVSVEKEETPLQTETKNEPRETQKEKVLPLQSDKVLSSMKPVTEGKREQPTDKPVDIREKATGVRAPRKTVTEKELTAPPPDSQKELPSPAKANELEHTILTYFNLGVDLYRQREITKAIQAYQKVIELDPAYVEAYNNLGIIYQDVGDFDKAIEAYQKAIEVNPQYEKAYNNLGILFFLNNRFEESIEAFQKALKINPGNIESYINLGILFKKQGEFNKAIECFQRALTINPLNGETHYNIGVLYEQLENIPLAISHYQKFIQLSSKTRPDLVSKVQRHVEYLMVTKGGKEK